MTDLIWDAEADAAWEALQADPAWEELAALRAEPVSLAASVSAAAAEIRAAGDEAHHRGVALAASMLAAIDAELALY